MTVVSEADASEWDTEDVTLAPVLEAVEPNVRVQEGDDAILKLTFSSGSGLPLNIHWTRGGGESLDGERFVADSGGGVLRIRGARRSDSGPYRARALVAGGGGGDGCPHVDYELDVYPAEGDVPAFLRRLTDLAVKVGTRTRLLVEIRSASQVKTAWLRQGKEVIPNERLHFLNEGSFFCLDVAPVTLEDSGEWAVVAQNIEGRSTCSCFLNVLVPKAYKKPFFVEELRAVLTSGGTVSLECKVIGVPTPQLKWFKDGDEIKAGDVFALSADPDDPTTLGTYTCEASNCMGKALSSSRVHVVPSGKQPDQKSLIPSGPVPKFKDNLKDQKVKIGGSLLLESKVDVPPWPKDISWFNPQGLVQEGGRYHIMADGLGGYSIAVNPVEAADQGQWKCVATSNLGLKSIAACNVAMSFPKNYRAPRFLEALRAVLTEEGLVSFECKVVGFPTPQLQWFKDGQELKPGDVYQLTGSNSLGSYCCIARNCMGEARSTAELTVEDIQNQLTEEEKIQLAAINQPPQFQVGLKSCQAEINQAFRFTVQVTVNPEPVVTWFRDDEELQGSENYSFLKEAHGFCHLSIQRLELIDQAEWKCVATNDYGQSVTSCFLKLNIPRHFKKPRFLECLRAVLSEEGAVNLECKVIGVPQPILKWYKDGKELCPGDIHKIISGEDGTCCLGVYTCEAHNCMGTVSSSASLLGFEQKPQEKSTEQAAPALALTRQPSLSTIQEERSSQMQSITIDDRQEVSFSFDGKEVSVSLYETPDLTEEEALQVVEMYAEELSEHVSEHNVIELPPMRFVKETSTSGHILMEAVVIDVSPDFYASAEDDLRTDADLEEFSISEEAYLQNANLSMQEDLPFDKINSEFLERALSATIPYDDVEKRTSPAKPKRKSRDSSSASESKKKHVEDDSSSPYSDALASEKDSKSQKDSFVSAIESPDRDVNIIKGFESELAKSSSIGIEKTSETKKTLDDPASIQERKKKQSKSRSVSKERDGEEKVTTLKRSLSKDRSDKELAKERSSDESSKSDSKRVKKMQKHSRRKSKSVDSEAEDDSLQEFERRKVLESNLKMEVESDQMTSPETQKRDVKVKSTDSEREDDSLIEFETRKSISLKEQLTEKRKNRDHSLKRGVKKRGSTDSSGREDDSLVEYEKRKNLPVGADDKSAGSSKPTRAKKGSTTKKGSSESSGKEDEAQKGDTEKKRKKKSSKQLPTTVHAKELTPETGVEVVQSSETDSVGRAIEMRRGREIASDVDSIKTSRDGDDETAEFDTAEDSAYDRSEMSVLESLTHSLQEMQRGLAMVGEQIKSSSSEEPESAKSSLSVLESLAQPISDIKKGIRTVEKQIINDSQTGDYSPSRAGITILETLAQPVQELQRTLALVEQKSNLEGVEESILEKTSQSIMETVAQPLQEFNRDIAIIQQQAVMDSTDSFETIQSFKPQLIEVQGGVLQSEKDLSSQVEELSEITMDTQSTYAQSVQELQKGLAQIVERHVYDSDKKPDDDLLPLTVKEIQEDLFENENFIRELKEFEIRIMKDSEVYFDRMDNYIQSINSKIAKAEEEELKDLLNSVCQMISPLNNLQSITSKCIENVAENPSCLQWDVRVSKENIMHSLTRPFEVLDGTINILGKVAECESVRETRKICIASLYKLSVPMDELKTTVKLVENLSPQTAIEFLLPPVENMLSAISGVNSELIRPEFVDNIVIDGGNVLKGLDDSLDIMINCINSIEKYSLEMFSSHKEENIISLSTLTKPLEDLQNNLHSLEKYIVDETQNESMNPSQLYHLVQELGKPLQNIRIELSIIKHQIELEEYSSFTLQPSAIIRDGSTLMFQLLEPIENMQKNVTCFNESVLSKPPDEPSHLRYVLYALSTLTQPMNVLCSTIMKTEEQLLQEIPSVSEPSLGLRIVTQSVSELRQSIESIKNQSHEILLQPELLIVSDILSTLSSPLLEVEEGLSSLSDQVYDEDKTALNINLLKTMAEPFKGLQKALIEISNELSNENISEAVVFELKQPVQELQRSILVIQDQVSFEYGDEPTTIESNIVTLQSLIQPMKTLKRHFINVQKVIAEQNKSVDTQLAQKVIDISKVMHKLQLKISSLMVQQSYFRVSKHSGRLELFPILQHMVQFISDFERAQQLTVQYIERKQRLDVIKLKEKILNNMQYLKMDMINLHKKLYTLKDLSPSDSSSTEILTKAIHEFTNALMDECTMLAEESLDDGMAVACLDEYFESFVEHINVLHSKLLNIETLSSDMDDKEKMKQRITFQDQSPKKVKILELSLNALQGKLFSMMNVVEHNLQNESAGLSVQIIENMMSCTNAMKENMTSLKMETKLTDLKEADEICNRAVEELRDCMALLSSEMNNVSDMFSESSVRSLSATVENITACQVDISKKLEDIILSLEEKEKAPQIDDYTGEIPRKDEIMGSINIVNENIKQKLVKISEADSSHRKIILSEPVQSLTAQLSDLSTNIFSSDIKNEMLTEGQVQENIEIMAGISSSLLKLEEDVKREESINRDTKEQIISSVKNLQKAVTSITEDVKENQTISAFDQIIEPLNDFNETIVGHDDMKPKLSPLRAVMGEEFNEAETLKETSFRILEEFAKASSELEFGLMKVEHNLLNISEMKKGNIVTFVEPLVQPIQKLCEKISLVEEILSDPTVEEHMSSLSMLKTLAEPIRDIQHNIVEIQEHCIESAGKQESGEKVLQVIAKPIRELRTGVALIQEQAMVMEADSISISESLSSSETLAKPLEELKKVLSSIVNQQTLVYEPGTELMSEDRGLSELETIAKPVRELQKQLAAIETQQLLEGSAVDISVKEAIATVAKPVTELRYALATIENQIALESTDSISSDKYAIIKTLEKSLYEVSRGIACINEQQVLEDVVTDSTLSDIPTMASPVESPLLRGLEINEPTVLDSSSLLLNDEIEKSTIIRSLQETVDLSATVDQQVIQEFAELTPEGIDNLHAKKLLVDGTKTSIVSQQPAELESEAPLPQLKLVRETAESKTVLVEQGVATKTENQIFESFTDTSRKEVANEEYAALKESSFREIATVEEQISLSQVDSFEVSQSVADRNATVIQSGIEVAVKEEQKSLLPLESLESLKSTTEAQQLVSCLEVAEQNDQPFVQEDVETLSEIDSLSSSTVAIERDSSMKLGAGLVKVTETKVETCIDMGVKNDLKIDNKAKEVLEKQKVESEVEDVTSKKLLESKGDGKLLNKEEIFECGEKTMAGTRSETTIPITGKPDELKVVEHTENEREVEKTKLDPFVEGEIESAKSKLDEVRKIFSMDKTSDEKEIVEMKDETQEKEIQETISKEVLKKEELIVSGGDQEKISEKEKKPGDGQTHNISQEQTRTDKDVDDKKQSHKPDGKEDEIGKIAENKVIEVEAKCEEIEKVEDEMKTEIGRKKKDEIQIERKKTVRFETENIVDKTEVKIEEDEELPDDDENKKENEAEGQLSMDIEKITSHKEEKTEKQSEFKDKTKLVDEGKTEEHQIGFDRDTTGDEEKQVDETAKRTERLENEAKRKYEKEEKCEVENKEEVGKVEMETEVEKRKVEKLKNKIGDEASKDKEENTEENKKKAEEAKMGTGEGKGNSEKQREKLGDEGEKDAQGKRQEFEDKGKTKLEDENKRHNAEAEKKCEEENLKPEVEERKKAKEEGQKFEQLKVEAKMTVDAEQKKLEDEVENEGGVVSRKLEEKEELQKEQIKDVTDKRKLEVEHKINDKEENKKLEKNTNNLEDVAQRKTGVEQELKVENKNKGKQDAEELKKKLADEEKKQAEDGKQKLSEEENKKQADVLKKDEDEERKPEDEKRKAEDGKRNAEEHKKELEDEEQLKAEVEKKTLEGKSKRKADVLKEGEDVKRNAEEPKEKLADDAQKKAEAEKKKLEEGNKRKAEEQKKKLGYEEQKKAETEKKKAEEENQKKKDGLKKTEDEKKETEEHKKKLEDEAKMKAVAEKKKLEDQKKKLEDKAKVKEETEEKKLEEEKKIAGELKKVEDEKKEVEEQKKKLENEAEAEKKKLEEEQKSKLEDVAKVEKETEKKKQEEEIEKKAEEQKKRLEDEAKIKAEAEKKKQEEENEKKAEEQKKILEDEAKKRAEAEKLKLEEENKKAEELKKVEDEEKKAKEQKKKLEHEAKVKEEAEENKQEEEIKHKAEEHKKRLQDEALNKAEADKKKLEEGNKRKAEELEKVEEQKKKLEDEAKMKEETEKKKQEEETKKKAEEQKKKLEDEAKMKAEAEKKKQEEETKKKAEEQKKIIEVEAKKKAEAEKKKLEEETKKKAEEQKKKLEDEAKMKAEAEKKKQEEETKKKSEEQKKIIEVEAKKKAEAEKKKQEEETKKKAEEQKKKLEDEAKMKAEEEKKKKEEETKKKAEEQKKIIEDEAKMKAEEDKKKLEEDKKKKKKAEEQKKILEDEEKKKLEEENKKKVEDEKKKAEELKKKVEDETKIKAEAEKKKLEEETKKKAEEQKKKLEDEAKMKAEAEKKEQEEETKKKAEEQKKIIEVETKKKAEAEKKKLEEETKKKAEEQKKKLEDEAKMKAEAEKKEQEEETKKKAEEQKKIIEVEAKKKAEAEKKKLEEETKKKAEEQKKKLEDEAKMKADAEKKKQEEETKKKAEEQKKIIEVEAKKKAEAEKKKLEEETKKKAEEQKKKLEYEAKMKAEAEKKKQEEETKKKAEEQKKIIEDETKKKAEADKKKQEEDNQKKAEEQKKVVEDEAVKKAEAEKKKLKEENKKVKDEKKKAEELKIKVEDEAKMKAELEVKKQEDETKKKAEEQKNKLEDEAKMKAEAETKKLEEENKKKSEEQEKKHANETKKKSEELEEEKKQLKDDASQKSEVKNKKSRSEKEDDKKKKLKLDSKKKTENDTEVKTKEDEEEARIDENKSSEKKNLEIEAREKAKLKLELTVNDDEKILEEKGISKKDGELKKKRDDEAVKTLVTEVPEGKMDKEGHGNNLGLVSPKDRIDESSFDKRDKYSSFQLAIEEEIDVSKHGVAAERKIRSRSQESAFWVSTTSEPKYKRDDSFAAKSSEVPPRQTWAKREAKCKPYFCGRLMDRTAAQESKVKMSCSFIGNPEPTISWLKDGLPLLHGASDPLAGRCEIKVSNGVATIEIYSASPSDCGRYSCVVSNALGQATTTATLRIFEKFEPTPSPPTFTRRIQDKYDFRADELILECKVQGQPKPAITWRKDDRSLPARGRYQQTEALDGTCRLVISGPEPQDSGVYTCHAENAVWNEQISDVVTFEGRASYAAPAKKETSNRIDYRRPFIANLLGDHNVPAGGTLALHVQLKEKSPGSQISWYRGTEPLSRLSTRAKYFKEDDTYSLVLPEVKPQEAGLYICRVTNAFGHSDTCANVRIISFGSNSQMRGKPAMFTRRPDTTLHIVSGEDVSVSFRLSGDPKPKVTWMKGLKDMTSNARSMKETIDDCTRLTLKRATIYDSGTYFIVAKNIYGCDRAFFTVQVRQRSRSLTPISSYGILDTSTILRDIHEIAQASLQDVPGAISSEPVITDSGRTWLTITWGKPTHRGAAPILAYKVEAWEVGELGGARWSELGVTPMNSFDAFDLRPGSAYRFRITARNRYGWGEPVVTRDPLTVVNCDQIAPEIVSDLPGSLKALINTNLTLQCEVRGEPTPDIRWFRDGKEVAMARHACDRLLVSRKDGICNLMIRDLIPQDSGRYVCEAANKVGRASTFARLLVVHDAKLLKAADLLKRVQEDELTTLESPPQFSLRLRDRRIQVSNPIRLTCQVVGFPAPKITWLKDGTEIKADDHFSFWSEQGFETLEISRSKMEDAGEYTAEARNEHGSVACSCRLVVDKGIKDYIAPGFLAGIEKHAKIREGATLRLRATVEAYPSVDIMWHRDGTRLRQSRRLTCTLDREGHIEFTLAELTCRDAGTYTCTATNEVGRCETVCDVTVTPKLTSPLPSAESVQQTDDGLPYSQVPMFTVKPRSTDALEGDTVILMCEVVGDPEPEIFCLRDGLKPDYYHHGPRFESHREGHRYRLEIPQVRLDFTGAYAIIARNQHGEARAVVSLQIYARGQGKEGTMSSGEVKQGKVQTLPAVRKELKDMRCCDGDSVTLECQVYATPPPDIRWLKDGKILPLGGDISSNVDGEVARLTISKVYPEDEGEYTCMAYNELGRALTSSCLIVDVPEEKETMVTRQLAKPPGFLSTPSTPRTTPSRSISPGVQVTRDFSTPLNRPQRKRTKFSSPKFYAVPHNKVAQEGETVKFQCSAAGHPNPWASWDKDGHIVTPTARLSLLEQDDMRILQIKEVTPEDAGLYRVTLENDYGSVEATARLEVIAHRGTKTKGVRAWSASRASPTFGRRLVGSAARVGDAFTLACDVQASPSPVVTWYRNTEAVVKSDRIKPLWDGRTARLKLKNLEREDAGVYTCVAENELGTTRCSAELIVLSEDDPSDADLRPPVFLVGLPDTTSTPEGQPLELQVKLQGTQPLEVVWSKDEVELPDCMDFRYVDYGDGRFGLRIADAFPADAGHYSCEAFNKHGDAVSYGHLEVTDASDSSDSTKKQLYFTKTPIPLEAEPGQSACFCARVHSPAKTDVHIDWSVASHPTSEQPERFKVERDGDSTVLRIDPVKLEDIGPISCRAHICIEGHTEPSAGCSKCYVTSCTSRLSSVPGAEGWPAQLLHGPADTTALRGQRVILQAAYSGSPQPIVRWLKAGRELSNDGCMTIINEDGLSSLILDPVSADDSGKYVVSVENSHGADCHFASVAVEGPPDPPAGRPSVRTFNSTATIAWSSPPYDGGCMVTGYRVEMKKLPQTSWTVVTDRCHSLSHTVHDLAPGIEYAFRVRAENVHGASEASAETPIISIGAKPSSGSEEDEVCDVKKWERVKVEPGEVFTGRYEIMEELGKGRYGVVHKVVDKKSSQKMAAKFVRCIKKQDKQKVFEEIEIMNCLRHPKLLQLVSAYDNTREIVMVTEYITGGELFERVVADDFTLTERDCMLFMRQICEGVDYMHQNSVVHLDLKPENIMCYTRTSHQIKIIDFGLAQQLSPSIILRVLFGTPEFIPPEIINYEPIGVESDMWSVGVICYVLLSGLSPFMGDNDAETFANITRADFDFDDEAFDAISQDVKDLISNLLVKRKEKRFSARQCLEHKWMSQCDKTMSCVKLSTDKLKKFIIRRKWQKTGNAIRALGRMATLSAASRRNSGTSSQSNSPRQSLAGGGVPRMSSLNEEEQHNHVSTNEEIHQQQYTSATAECNGKNSRVRVCSERSDSGISDCSSINAPTSQQHHSCQPLTDKAFSISEENELCDSSIVESKLTRFHEDTSRTHHDRESKLRFDTSKKHQFKEATKTSFADNLKPSIDEASFKGSLRRKVEVENKRNDSIGSVSFVSTNKRLEDREGLKGIKSPSLTNSPSGNTSVSYLKESSGLPSKKSTNRVSSSPFLNNSFLTDDSSLMKRPDDKCLEHFSDTNAGRTTVQAGGLKVADVRARSVSPALQKDAKVLEKSENFQKAFAFWKR